ncbi:hypothetical protein KJ657_01715 [Patescibacteria group bacterium]|nr:hypothetical protein [Patescibacteria group bacterium]MBU1015786.1 hypothetical protein [Patescibacteria group bacterium]MBU1685339.1 hypothetical protein [Patescibacteria group bacterium]MBU1938267.1 hypothetical protein [Patescibacteria group bacterium]
MNVQRENGDRPIEDVASGSLQICMSEIEGLPVAERRLTYRECAKYLLIRYLVEKNLVDGPLSEEECRPSVDECVAENADGICFLFYVRGNVWDVILSRKEEGRKIIAGDPERLEDPKLFVMDLGKAAKINPRNSDFHK